MRRRCCRRPGRVPRRRCGSLRPCGNGRATAASELPDFRRRYGSGSDALRCASVLAVLSPDRSVRASSPSNRPTDQGQGTPARHTQSQTSPSRHRTHPPEPEPGPSGPFDVTPLFYVGRHELVDVTSADQGSELGGDERMSHPFSTVPAMTSASPQLAAGNRQYPRRASVGRVCMVELRARLARRCEDESGGGSVVRRAIETAVGSVAGAGPLVDAKAVRSAHDEDLVWCAQSVQRAINMLEGARSSLAAEVVRRQLHARRGEASGAETLVNATAVGGALARRIEREAQALDAQPAVAEVLGRGEITSDQAAAVAAADVPDDVRNDLCKQARNQTADQTRQTVRSAEAAWRRESEAQRHARQRAARSASMWIDPNDGMWHLRAKFDALTGDAINRLLISAIERNWRSDKDLPESKRRSVQQRAADALAWLLTSAGVPGAGVAGGDGATPSGAVHSDAMLRDGATPGGAQHTEAMPRDGATPGGAQHTETVPRDAAAADGAPGAGRASRGAPDARSASRGAPGAGSASRGAPDARSAARDAGGVVGEGLRDDGWVVPSPTQMIVLTTLDNLRGASAARQPDAGCPGPASTPVCDLLAVPGAVATTETGTVLGVADARKIACDTRVIPVVMGGPGEVLDVGRATRTIPPAIRRALIARDQGCVWPGCDRAPIHCDGHHIQHWLDDGPTSLVNLALLCHSHHHRLHKYNLMLHPPKGPAPPGEGWTVTPAPSRKARTPATDRVRQNC